MFSSVLAGLYFKYHILFPRSFCSCEYCFKEKKNLGNFEFKTSKFRGKFRDGDSA